MPKKSTRYHVHDSDELYVNNLVGDVKANPRDFYRYINSQKKDVQGIPPLKKRNGSGLAESRLGNGQFVHHRCSIVNEVDGFRCRS